MMKKLVQKILLALMVTGVLGTTASAEGCMDKLFSVTINDSLTIGDAIDNLAETCGLTVIVKDSGAQMRLKKNLYYVKLKNASLKSFLDTLLKDNDLNYTLKGNKLTISYLVTRTFKVHYVAGKRTGKSSANVTIAGATSTTGNTDNKSNRGSTITIETNQEFQFWSTLKDEIHRILNTAGDGSVHFTKVGDSWIGPDGQKWEYNPLEPIINPEAGMVTVTGTARQIERVSRYLATLMKQIKTQVMIDVRILYVTLDQGRETGIDWSQLYGIQNIAIDAGAYSQSSISDLHYKGPDKSYNATGAAGGYVKARMLATVKDVVKFLDAQGDVTIVSSPRVMTMNNQPAMISVGREYFYKLTTTNQLSGADNAATQGEEVNSVFAGILLDITPEVDERGLITLKINPSISNTPDDITVTDSGTRTMPPDLIRRQIASVIKVRDGDHAILGGLITKTKGVSSNKVPLLGDIPILGHAFKREKVYDKTEELVIIITPHIINNHKNVSLKDLGYKTLK